MSEWFDNQHKPNSNFRKLLQERIEQAHPCRSLNALETKRLSKLEGIADKLRRGENVQNRQLQTLLSEDEYGCIEAECQEQPALREELKDKPSELKRYEEKLKQVTFNYNRDEGYSSKGSHSTAKNFYNKSESLWEDALEILQEILHYDSRLTSKQSVKLAVVERAIHNIGRDAAPASKYDVSKLDKFLNMDD